jgi:hypothetical protein
MSWLERLKKLIPALGIVGRARLREAEASEDMVALKNLLEGALRRLFALEGQDDVWPWVQALFPDRLVVERDGRLLSYPYTVDGTDVTFGEPEEVVNAYEPVDCDQEQGDPPSKTPGGDATFTEAAKQGRGARAFEVRIVRAGLSYNGNYYPDAVLREAAPLAEGVRVFVKSDEDHLAGRGTDIRNLIGRICGVSFKEGRQPDSGALYGTFELMEPEGAVAVKLREAWDNNMADLFGFSIDAGGSAAPGKIGGRPVRRATKITAIDSVDLIVRPGAGGGIVRFKESEDTTNEGDSVWREKLIAAIKKVAPHLLEGVDVDALTDEELDALSQKAFAAPASDNADFTEALRMVETRAYMRDVIGRSALPELAKVRLREQFGNRASFTEAEVDRAIRTEADYLSSLGGGQVSGLGGVDLTRSSGQGTRDMLDAFFNPRHKDHGNVRSFRECYIHMTGDTRVTGRIANCNQGRFREALDSQSFELVLGDAIHRQLLAEYAFQTQYDIWKYLVHVVPVGDFREQHRTRYGGYGDLPIVAESQDYGPLKSPTDEGSKYAVKKRGGTESVTLEMIKNDDVGAIQRIPGKLNIAAKRTLGRFCMDFLRTNPVIYDNNPLFSLARGNMGTVALNDDSFAAARLAMLQMKERDSNEPLGIPPKVLWIPAHLERLAFDLFRRDTNLDETFVQSQHPTVVSVWYWTDPKSWVVSAAQNELPCFELGFLDGQEEPELFVQDNPTVGSLFNNDTITYKIRHIYGGTITDFRGLYKAVVA